MRWKPGRPVKLESERFVLRSLTERDVTERYLGWARDAEVMRMLNNPPTNLTRQRLAAHIGGFDNRSSFLLGVFRKDTGLHIGFYTVHCDLGHETAQTNVVIGDRDYWGKNVVLETRAVLMDFLFETLKMHKIWGMPFARNLPAVYNYKAQGFACEGILRAHRKAFDGGRLDQLQFALFRDDWRARKRNRTRTKDGA